MYPHLGAAIFLGQLASGWLGDVIQPTEEVPYVKTLITLRRGGKALDVVNSYFLDVTRVVVSRLPSSWRVSSLSVRSDCEPTCTRALQRKSLVIDMASSISARFFLNQHLLLARLLYRKLIARIERFHARDLRDTLSETDL